MLQYEESHVDMPVDVVPRSGPFPYRYLVKLQSVSGAIKAMQEQKCISKRIPHKAKLQTSSVDVLTAFAKSRIALPAATASS